MVIVSALSESILNVENYEDGYLYKLVKEVGQVCPGRNALILCHMEHCKIMWLAFSVVDMSGAASTAADDYTSGT